MTQCKKCPWRKDVNPYDIPNGYCKNRHAALESTIARGFNLGQQLRFMACHETPVGSEKPCVGWMANQLGPGNNIALRIWATTQKPLDINLVGEQHETFEQTLPQNRTV